MAPARKIGVLMGGRSEERAISLSSGEAVLTSLTEAGYQPVAIDARDDLDQQLRALGIEVAFLALHGAYGEDGCVQGLLEWLRIPYTGSSVMASSIAMHKAMAKTLFRSFGVSTPESFVAHADAGLESIQDQARNIGFPVYVKPVSGGSSLHAGRADDPAALQRRLEQVWAHAGAALVERFVAGRELTVGVLDGAPLGVLEIVPAAGVYDFDAKYKSDATAYQAFDGSRAQERGVAHLALRACHALGVTGAARVDIVMTPQHNEFVLEVNAIPGLRTTSLLPRSAALVGMDHRTLCARMLDGARLYHTPR